MASPVAASGAAASPAAGASRQGGTVTIGMFTSPGVFLPQYTTNNAAIFVNMLYFSSLVQITEQQEFTPLLAERWEVSADRRAYTFYLHPQAKWSDGVPVTAHDVEFTLLTVSDPRYNSSRFAYIEAIEGATDRRAGKQADLPAVKVIDDKTIQITTGQVDASFLEQFGTNVWILPKHILKDTAPDDLPKLPYATQPTVGSGPFKLTRYVTDQYVELDRDPNYYRGRANLDKIIIRITKPDVAVAQLERGEVDIVYTGLAPTDLDRLRRLPTLDVVSVPSLTIEIIIVNVQDPLLKDKRVRQAIMYGVNRRAIVERILQNEGALANGPIPPASRYYNASLNAYPYDPERAKQLLAAANWDPNAKLTLFVPSGNKPREQAATVIQQSLAQIGMQMELQQGELAAIVARMNRGELPMAIAGFANFFDPDVSRRYLSTSPGNLSRYVNPRVDELLSQGRARLTFEERKPIYDELQTIINDDLPILPLYAPNTIGAINKRVAGAQLGLLEVVQNAVAWSVRG